MLGLWKRNRREDSERLRVVGCLVTLQSMLQAAVALLTSRTFSKFVRCPAAGLSSQHAAACLPEPSLCRRSLSAFQAESFPMMQLV